MYINILTIYAYISGKENILDFDKIKKGSITKDQENTVVDLWGKFISESKEDLTVLDQTDCPSFDPASLSNFLDNLYNIGPFHFLVFDYIQRLRHHTAKGYDMKELMNVVVSTLQEKCTNIGKFKDKIVLLLLSQAKREGMAAANRNEGKYSMTDTAEVNAIERDSFYIMSLWADEESIYNNNVKYQLLKNRSGITLVDPVNTYVDAKNFILGDIYLENYNNVISNDSFDDLIGIEDATNNTF